MRLERFLLLARFFFYTLVEHSIHKCSIYIRCCTVDTFLSILLQGENLFQSPVLVSTDLIMIYTGYQILYPSAIHVVTELPNHMYLPYLHVPAP
jgi:hypothetical protein